MTPPSEMVELDAAKDAKAVEKIIKEAEKHKPFLDDDLAVSLEIAFEQAEERDPCRARGNVGAGRAGQVTLRYHLGEINHCPGCGRSQWIVGRVTAECAFCMTALPLADSGARTPRIISIGSGGGKVRRMLAAAA